MTGVAAVSDGAGKALWHKDLPRFRSCPRTWSV